MVAPFLPFFYDTLLRTPSLRSFTLLSIVNLAALLLDSHFVLSDLHTPFPAYVALAVYGMTVILSQNFHQRLSITFKSSTAARGMVVLVTAVSTLPLHVLGQASGTLPPYPDIPMLSLLPLPFLSGILLFLLPASISSSLPHPGSFPIGFIPTAVLSSIICPFFTREWPWSDTLLFIAYYFSLRPSPSSSSSAAGDATRRAPSTSTTMVHAKSYLRTILANSESSKIFYFLLLNLAFMLVQMVYGVWTNSLGLISDAIHMAFDCMAIGMGLFASVMATWEPNERFTYGYGRIETLSGFANGIFLILISVFIIFEAVQRL